MLMWQWVILRVLLVWPLWASWWGMDALTERITQQYVSGFMLTVASQAKRHYLLPFYFFPLPLGLFPWDSYQFVLILPRPMVAVWKLRCRHGKKMCVYLCVCLFVSGGGRKSSEEKGKEKVKQWRRWQVEGGSLGFFPCHRKSVWPVTKCQANEDGSGGRA